MADVYTRRVGLASAPFGASRSLYTVPPGAHAVVRDLVLDNTSGTASQVIVYGASGLNGFTLLRASLPANSTTHAELRQALIEGDSISIVNQGSAGAVGILVTAYVFD